MLSCYLFYYLVQKIDLQNSPGSIYVGKAGLSLIFLQKALLQENPDIKEIFLKDVYGWAEEGLVSVHPHRQFTFLEGMTGPICLSAVALFYLKDTKAALECYLKRLQSVSFEKFPANQCELLYGRAGYLYSLLFAQHHIGRDCIAVDILRKVVSDIILYGRTASETQKFSFFPLYYEWHEKCYFGAAHGITGILLTLLNTHLLNPSILEPYLEEIFQTIDELLKFTFQSKNLPSSLSCSLKHEKEDDEPVQWCHGASGLIPLLCVVSAVYFSFITYVPRNSNIFLKLIYY